MKRCFSLFLAFALLAASVITPVSAEMLEFTCEDKSEESSSQESLMIGFESEICLTEPESPASEDDSSETESSEVGAVDLCAFTLEDSPRSNQSPLQLNESDLYIGIGETFKGLCVVTQPEDDSAPAVVWRSSDKKKVTVNSKTGVIKGIRKGTAVIYAKTDDGREATCSVTVGKKPTSVSLNPKTATLSVGMTGQLTPMVSGGFSGSYTFKTNKKKVATVDGKGRVTAVAPGKATITVKTYNGKKASCKITVIEAPVSVAFRDDTVSLACEETTQVTANAYNASGNAIPAVISYGIDESSSSDPDCIRVDTSSGTVTAIRQGEAILTATTQNGKVAKCRLIVDNVPQNINLNFSDITIGVNEIFKELKAQTSDGIDISSGSLYWKSKNEKVATVDNNGFVKGKKTGSTTIVVALANGKTAECSVKVMKEISSISISPEVGSLRVGRRGQYKIKLKPSKSGGSLYFESSDPSVASVDGSGIVTAIAKGEAYITVTAYNGKSAKAKLIVKEDDSGETISEKIQQVIDIAKSQLNKPYVHGGGYAQTSPSGFDCSGLVYWCYLHVGIKLKDSAYRQGYDDTYEKIEMSDLKPGDVLVFDTDPDDSDKSDHTAIYIGNGEFIHASSTAKKVIQSSLEPEGSYYYRTFSWGRRILN